MEAGSEKLSDLVDQRVTATVADSAAALQGQITTLEGQVTALQAMLVAVLGATPCVRGEGNEVIFEGCNVHVRSGAGATGAAVNGLGNLIVGYKDGPAKDSSVSGGRDNTASGQSSSVSGGFFRSAPGPDNWAAGPLLHNF